jgi:chromosome segregation ATPase
MEKLNSKEKELIDCRKQIIELNRRLANTSSSPTQTDLLSLAHENEELMANIEEIKSAAIDAIMMKEEEIDELNKTISKYDLMESELKFQYDKYESLEREFDAVVKEKEQDIEELTEKISREREAFLNRLQSIQQEASQSESFKEIMLEKANDLEGTIEKSEHMISEYENKLLEMESQMTQQKLLFDKERAHLQIELEEAKDDIKLFQREERNVAKLIEELKNKEKTAQETIARLTETN